MATVTIRDEAIWISHIENGQRLRERILSLKPEETLDLEVNGVVGRWARMRNGKDGRPRFGIRPIRGMRAILARMRRLETGKSCRSARSNPPIPIWPPSPRHLTSGTRPRMRPPVPSFERGETVVVPFPFVEVGAVKRRPALILSARETSVRRTRTCFAL